MKLIPYLNLSCIHEPIKEQLNAVYEEVVKKQWFIQGEFVDNFEKKFAQYCGARYCIGVGNGLDAIRLILQALDIGVGDEVIVPANTFIATALAVTYVGARPVFVDASIDTYNIDISQIESKISKNTKAIIGVHLYGRAVEFDKLQELKERYNIKLIEDAAQAHGAIWCNKRVGTLGDAAAFSFYPGKNLGALGDAGAVTTNDEVLANKIRAISNYGAEKKYVHEYKGCNSRLDELQAGFLGAKLAYLDQWNEERRNIARKYNSEIKNNKLTLPKWDGSNGHVFHIYPVLCEKQNELVEYLKNKGIFTNIHYPTPICLQKAYYEYREQATNFPVTNRICSQEVSIPLYPGLSIEEQEYIINALNQF